MASNLVSLPQTITSRCQVLKFLPVNSQEIYDHLVTLKIDKKKAKTLAAISYGRPGVALNFDNNKEEYQDYLADIRQFLALSKASLNEKFRMLGEMFKKTDIDSTKHLLDTWVKIIRDSLLIKNNSGHFVNHLSVASELQNFSEDYDNNKLVGLIAEIEKSKQYLNENVNTKLVLENLVLTF